ncbi:hypothetical protein GF324_10340, partial [bacterium]|nr:hypothetical protein [bacterium]
MLKGRMWMHRTYRSFQSTVLLVTSFLLLPLVSSAEPAAQKGFMRFPDLHESRVVFTSSSDLWVGDVAGGTAHRLTAHPGEERFPKFSPDGKWIAFSGQYNGSEDVYVMPAGGGQPRQLTYHPSYEHVAGWTPDGQILFRRRSLPPWRGWTMYTVDPKGDYPERIADARIGYLSYEPGGDRVALVPEYQAFTNWRRYQGGEAETIWVGTLDPARFENISQWKGNEGHPMWADDGRIYHVSDSLGRANLWSMLPDGSDLRRETDLDEFDVLWPSMDGNRIVFQYGVELRLFDLESRTVVPLEINAPTDLYVARTRFVEGSKYVDAWSLSDNGRTVLAESRGEVFTMPVKAEGLIRQWTFSSDSREKLPVFLPEGDGAIGMVTDESGEERIVT